MTELGNHLPFSIFGVLMGISIMGVLTFMATLMRAEDLLPHASEDLFHVTHAGHILLSAITTTAMFWKHEKRILKAILVGLVGSITICGISDILIPYLGGKLLGMDMAVHICLIEEPGLVIPFAVFGVLAGLLVPAAVEKSTEYSHSAHVLFSSSASIIYLLAFGFTDWVHFLGSVFIITVVAVAIPCCVSDIVFPLACVHRNCSHS